MYKYIGTIIVILLGIQVIKLLPTENIVLNVFAWITLSFALLVIIAVFNDKKIKEILK